MLDKNPKSGTTTTISSTPEKSFQEMSLPEKKKYLAEGISKIPRDLGRGMSGDDVLMLQNALLILGYMTVAPNGNFGPKTEDALVRFKLANNLATDPNDIKTKRFGGNTKKKIMELLSAEDPKVIPRPRLPEVSRPSQKIATRQKRVRMGILTTLLPMVIGVIGVAGGTWVAVEYVPKLAYKFFPELDPENQKSEPSPESPNPFFPGHKPPTPPAEPPKETLDKKIEKLLGDNALRKKLEEATVLLETGAKKGADGNTYVSSCAGFIVDRQTVLTAAHCLRDDTLGKIKSLDRIIGLEEGGQLSRKIKTLWPVPGHDITLAASGDTDFGLIRFDKPYFNPSRVISVTSTPPSPGEPYIMMGHPMGVPWKIEGAAWKGVVHGDPRGRRGNDGVKGVYELSGEVHGGNSGGPVVNAKGEVIGVAVASTEATFSDQRTYAIPLDQTYVQGMIHELLDEKPTPTPDTPKKEKTPKPKKKKHVPEMKKHQKGRSDPRSESIEDLLKQLERQRRDQRNQDWRYR